MPVEGYLVLRTERLEDRRNINVMRAKSRAFIFLKKQEVRWGVMDIQKEVGSVREAVASLLERGNR